MVSLETINVGLASNDKKGDPLRNAMQKVNLNFTALNTAIQKVLDGKGQVNGYASLGADGRLAASQVPVPFAVNLPSGINLDTYVTPGTYHQNTNAGAAAGANYPSPHAGLLEVFAPGNATNFAYQFYTRFRSGGANQTRYWRTGYGTPLVWGNWAEFASSESGLMHYGFMPAAQDLDNYRTRGIWNVSTATIASGGTNFPIVQAGNFIVYAQVGQGQSPAGYVVQQYTAANANRTYTRVYSGTAWGPWVYNLDSSVLGVASGIPQLGSDTRLLPAQAPILYSSVIVAGTDANTVVVPGCYYLNSDAQATAALNWPMLLAGTLMVEQSTTGNAQVTQTYTTRNGTGGVLRTFKRVRFGTGGGTWGTWQELARYDDAMTHVYLTAATDANSLSADNIFYTFSSATVMTGGSNWPPTTNIIGGSIDVRVIDGGRVVQTVTLPVTNSKPRVFQRFGDPRAGGVWQAWRMIGAVGSAAWLPTADAGDVYVDGAGWYTWNGTAYALTALATVLPTAAHDLNGYVTPGTYRQSSNAGAAAGVNYPTPFNGFLEVTTSGSGNCKQEYTVGSAAVVTLSTGARKFWRIQTNSTTWGPWNEYLTAGMGMTHMFLAAATDANTLTTDNTFYTWSSSAVPGANFPGYQAGGSMQVFWHSTAIVSQELTLLVAGSKPLKFARYGNPSTGVWQPWKVTSPFSGASWMPSSDMGDIDVDGRGTYRWNGSAYARWTPDVPGDFTMLMSNARIRGNFVGGDVTGALALQASSGNHTRWNVVPPAGASPAAASAGVVFSLADSPNTAFMNINSNADGHHFQSGVSGTSSYRPIIFWQVNARCGALNTAATWEFGPMTSYPVMARVAINYDGGVTRYGIVMRPNADDTRSFHFANAAGADCGSIQHSASATFFVTTSDYRIKSNVTDLPPEEGLGSVLRIRPRYFSMYGEDRLQRGFIAHELQEVIPEAVTGEKDAVYPAEAGSGPRMMLQGVDMSRIVPHLVAAIQALDTKLEAALARISELEG
jgi:hypothetical protein